MKRRLSSRWTVKMMALATVDAVLLYPRIGKEWLRIRCLFYGIRALMFLFNGEEWVMEADQNVLVSRRLSRSWECFEFRKRERLRKGHAFLYLGDWKL